MLREDERVRTDTERLEMLATIRHYIHPVSIMDVSLPRNHALLLVLHAFLDCPCLASRVFDNCLVYRCHFLLLGWQTPARYAIGSDAVTIQCSIRLGLVLVASSIGLAISINFLLLIVKARIRIHYWYSML